MDTEFIYSDVGGIDLRVDETNTAGELILRDRFSREEFAEAQNTLSEEVFACSTGREKLRFLISNLRHEKHTTKRFPSQKLGGYSSGFWWNTHGGGILCEELKQKSYTHTKNI
jgi:hypothetical protein